MVTSDLQTLALAVTVAFPSLAIITVLLRTYSRCTLGQFGLDDGLIIVAMIMSIGESFLMWGYIKFNYVGIHIYDIPEHNPVPGLKYNYAVQVLYNPILAIVKNSVLIFLLRLAGLRKSVKYTTWTLIGINTVMMVAIFASVILQCWPIPFNWDHTLSGACVNQGAFYVSTSVITIVTDLATLALPFWIVLGLNMPRKTKFAVVGVFFLGFIVTVVGVIRLKLLASGFFHAGPPKTDSTYDIGFCTSAIEVNTAIITASAAAMKHLLRRWFPRLFTSASRSYANEPSHQNHTIGSKSRLSIKRMLSRKFGYSEYEMSSFPGLSGIQGGSRGLTEIQSTKGGSESEEEIMTLDGIIKTTDVSIKYGDVRAPNRGSNTIGSSIRGN